MYLLAKTQKLRYGMYMDIFKSVGLDQLNEYLTTEEINML